MNFFRYIWYACSGFRTYTKLLHLPLGVGVRFWMGWTILLALVGTFNLFYWAQLGFKEIERWMQPRPNGVEQTQPRLPVFRIQNGRALSDLPQPYYSNTNHFPIILDLQEEIARPEARFQNGLMITKEGFRLWLEGEYVLKAPWSGWPEGEVNVAYLKDMEKMTLRLWPLAMIILWFLFIVGGLVQSLFFTVFVSFLEKTVQPSFSFQQIFNIALFSMVPASLIVATYVSLRVHLVGPGLLYFCIYCFMLVTASNACRFSLHPPSSSDSGLDDL